MEQLFLFLYKVDRIWVDVFGYRCVAQTTTYMTASDVAADTDTTTIARASDDNTAFTVTRLAQAQMLWKSIFQLNVGGNISQLLNEKAKR